MKALVLAGGAGTRLRPITYTHAKQLLPVANKPVLFYGLDAIRDAGISDVGIVVGQTASAIEAAVADGSALGLRVTYLRQDAPLGLAHAVRTGREYLGDDDFVMYLGDNIIADGIRPLVTEFGATRPAAQVMLAKVPDPRAYGVAEIDGSGRVTRLAEKPQEPASDLALVGVYAFTPAIHAAIDQIRPSLRGELEITDAIQRLADTGQTVNSVVTSGYWKDSGSIADLLEVNKVMLEALTPVRLGQVDSASQLSGRVVVSQGARVTRSRLVGPLVVGAGAVVSDSYIGPFTSLAEGCQIYSSSLANSIVLSGVVIKQTNRIEAALISRDASLTAR